MDLENVNNYNNFVSQSFNQTDRGSGKRSRMLSTSGITGKTNPELYSTLSKVDRSRTIDGKSAFSQFVKTSGNNTRTTSKISYSDRS